MNKNDSELLVLLGLGLLFIGSIAVLFISSIDYNNIIVISYLRDEIVEERLEIGKLILSNYPEPRSSLLLWIERVLAGVGIIFLFPFLLEALINEISEIIKWVIAGITGVVFLCATIIGIPIDKNTNVSSITPTPQTYISSDSLSQDEKIYFATLDVVAPQHIKQGQSQILELEFILLDSMNDTAIPLILPKAKTYSASIDTQLVNFEISAPSSDAQENRPVIINQPIKWQWVLTPKAEAEGNQVIVWNIELKDNQGNTYPEIPTLVIEIQIKPKLGVPTWILSPNFTLGAFLGGFALNWLGFRAKRKNEAKEKREAARKLSNTAIKTQNVKIKEKKQLNKYYILIIHSPNGILALNQGNYYTVPASNLISSASQSTIEIIIQEWADRNLGINISNIHSYPSKTKTNTFYAACSLQTPTTNITPKFTKYEWIPHYHVIMDSEGQYDKEMTGVIRKFFK